MPSEVSDIFTKLTSKKWILMVNVQSASEEKIRLTTLATCSG